MPRGRTYISVGPGPYGGSDLTRRKGIVARVAASTGGRVSEAVALESSGTGSRARDDGLTNADGMSSWTGGGNGVLSSAEDRPSPTELASLMVIVY